MNAPIEQSPVEQSAMLRIGELRRNRVQASEARDAREGCFHHPASCEGCLQDAEAFADRALVAVIADLTKRLLVSCAGKAPADVRSIGQVFRILTDVYFQQRPGAGSYLEWRRLAKQVEARARKAVHAASRLAKKAEKAKTL